MHCIHIYEEMHHSIYDNNVEHIPDDSMLTFINDIVYAGGWSQDTRSSIDC